jgi:RNA polymerase sigma-70 factor (ECF subfamily)
MSSASGAALAADLDVAFEELVLTFQDGLYRFAVGLSGDFSWAEEIVQDAFVRAYRALKTYDADRRLTLAVKPWLYRITLNVFRNSVRARRLELVSLEAASGRADDADGPEQVALRAAEWEQLLEYLRRLPDLQRAAIVLRYVHDLSYTAIAEVLDEPLNTVKSQVHRGIAALRRSYLQEVS